MRDPLTVVLAEDAALLREGLVGILTRAGHQVRAVEDADALVLATRADPPDIVVTDVRMPPSFSDEGLRAASVIRTENQQVGILVLSQYVADAYLPGLIDAPGSGGVGYLLVVRQLLSRRRQDAPMARLTPRELEVLFGVGVAELFEDDKCCAPGGVG